MDLPLYQIDAFTDRLFGGNPAAVCPLDAWLSDRVMQDIAAENNLSETAFFVADGDGNSGRFGLRWFTPKAEVDLCGHATLASAHLILDRLQPGLPAVSFDTKSGRLRVERRGDLLVMDFPARPAEEEALPPGFAAAIGAEPAAFLRASKNMAVFGDEETVRRLQPDLAYVAAMDGDGLIVTAPGGDCDFMSRYFAPHVGIDEDPVTGSAHCTSAPYWAARLRKSQLHARQVSDRQGDVFCELIGERVKLAGRAILYFEGRIHVP